MKSIETVLIDPFLQRLAERMSSDIGIEVEAAQIGDDPPFFFVARELLVGAEEEELLDRCIEAGGELIPPRQIPPQPVEVACTRRPGPNNFARPIKVRLDPSNAIEDAKRSIAEFVRDKKGGGVQVEVHLSSERAIALAAYAVVLQSEGRDVSLNYVGEPTTLPLKTIEEDPSHPIGDNPANWPWLGDRVRIVDAWQLFESYRSNGATENLVWIAIFDNGFWLDSGGVPNSADLANSSPLRNLIDGTQPIGGPGRPGAEWHGNNVASCAYAIVGNEQEVAGSGGTIARGALFRTNYAWDQVIECLVTAAAWGLDIVNMSFRMRGGFNSDSKTSSYNNAFKWAADNGVIIVVAAGNDNLKIPENDIRPAAHTPGVITVGNIDPASWTAFGGTNGSNFGSAVHIWAPGTNITFAPNGVGIFPMGTGTSFAAPFVAGVVAMMRAIKPGLRVEKVREILQRTAWEGTDDKVTHGLDAHAALLLTMDGRLPNEFEEWYDGGNNSAAKAALLAPVLGNPNRLGPIGGVATHNPGDHDWWRFTLASIRNVEIRLEWYERLGTLSLYVEPNDQAEGSVESLTRLDAPGSVLLSGILGPGTYRLRVTGNAISAYEIGVIHRSAVLRPDGFEPNQSFDTAATLLFHASQRIPYMHSGRRWWGPGTFEGTLHLGVVPFGRTWLLNPDVDYYLLDGRISISNQHRFCDVYQTDEPIDIVLYDKDRHLIKSWTDRSVSIKLEKAEIHYLELSSLKPTRYKIATYMMVDPRILPQDIDYAEVLPEWWGKSPFVKIDVNPVHYLVTIGSGDDDVNPAFEHGLALQDLSGDAHIALLDMEGHVVREAEVVAEPILVGGATHVVPIADLPPGAYYLRLIGSSIRETGVQATLRLMPPPRARLL